MHPAFVARRNETFYVNLSNWKEEAWKKNQDFNMITFHFHLQPQYKYELFRIYFTWSHCMGRYELNKLTLLPMCGFIAQLVEHRTGIAEVMGSNPVEDLIFFFRLLLSNCLNWKTTAVQIWIISYIFHNLKIYRKNITRHLIILTLSWGVKTV